MLSTKYQPKNKRPTQTESEGMKKYSKQMDMKNKKLR